jgi:RsiW-degrading membrane proteinase PrsW (M82 family)
MPVYFLPSLTSFLDFLPSIIQVAVRFCFMPYKVKNLHCILAFYVAAATGFACSENIGYVFNGNEEARFPASSTFSTFLPAAILSYI